MDSEEDMLDAHDIESGKDDFYSGKTDDYNDSDNGEPDFGFAEEDADDSAMIASHRSQKNYCVLREEDILRHQMDDIERVSVVLSITEVEASILLRHFHWSVGKVHDEWFADEERVRKTVGILESPVVPPSEDREIVARKGKNQYSWKGFGEIPRSLDELKEEGMKERFGISCFSNSEKVSNDDERGEFFSLTPDDQENSSSSKMDHKKEISLLFLSKTWKETFTSWRC